MQGLLVAPGVKDRKAFAFKRDALKEKDAITGVIRSIVATSPQRSAFHVLDLAKIVDLYRAWRRSLPDVRPYYTVKCNAEPALLGALAALGAGFDCSSRAAIEAVLALGVPPHSIVYANPWKPESHLEFAAEVSANLTSYDSVEEVAKVKRCHPKCELLLRIQDGGDQLGNIRYGALADEVVPLLRAAQREGLNVAGVSFHVWSGASRMDVYRAAIQAARAVFDAAAALGMPPMRVLDIGGGFRAGATFDEEAAVINDALAQRFGDLQPCVEVIAEPGRYFPEKAFTLAARVIGKRTRGEAREYWIDDGVYGSLSCVRLDRHYVPRPRPLTSSPRPGETTYTSTVFGPTLYCDDTVVTGYKLPEMSVGDWLVFDDMGAYTRATSDINIYVAYST